MFTKRNLPYLLTLTTLFKSFLTLRQLLCITKLKNHPSLKEKELSQTKKYNQQKLLLSITKLIYTLCIDTFIINTNFIHTYYHHFTKGLLNQYNLINQSIFFVCYSFFGEVCLIPFELISIFVIEERFGYNKMSFSLFVTDFFKSNILFGVINFVFVSGLLWFIKRFTYFYLYAFVFLVFLQVFLIVLYPTVILPLFNKFNELEEGELRSEIDKLICKINGYLSDKIPIKKYYTENEKENETEEMNEEIKENISKEKNEEKSEEVKEKSEEKNEEVNEKNEEKTESVKENKNPFVKVKKILKMDGSKRSHHSNAYFIGLFKEKRIVLYDTLLSQLSTREIIAVLAHEFGHACNNHILKHLLLIFFAQLAILFNYSFTRDINEVMIIDLIYFSYYLSFVNILMSYLQNFLSRKFETQADEFGVKLGLGTELKEGLIKIHKDNKAPPVTDKWYSVYVNSHPTLEERVSFIDQMLKKEE